MLVAMVQCAVFCGNTALLSKEPNQQAESNRVWKSAFELRPRNMAEQNRWAVLLGGSVD